MRRNTGRFVILGIVLLSIVGIWVYKNSTKTTDKVETDKKVEEKVETDAKKNEKAEEPKVDSAEVKEEDKKQEAEKKTEEPEKKTEEKAEEKPAEPTTSDAGVEGYKTLLESEALNEAAEGDFDLYNGDNIDVERYKEYKRPMMIVFGSENCIYCKQMQPDLVKLNEEINGKALVKYIDINKYPEFSAKWPIQATPAIILVDSEGKPYEPSEKYAKNVYKFKAQGSEDHSLSMAFGKLDKSMMEEILGEMNHAR